jgi:hypothetical protein
LVNMVMKKEVKKFKGLKSPKICKYQYIYE